EAALRLVEKVNPVRFGDACLPNSFDVVISTLQIIQHELGNVRAGEADLLIHPELHDYWVLEFWRAADIIERGRRASRGRASPDPGQDRGLPRKGRRVTRALAVLLVLAPLTIARAGTLAGVELADTVTVDGVTLVLNGMGLRQVTRLRVSVRGRPLPRAANERRQHRPRLSAVEAGEAQVPAQHRSAQPALGMDRLAAQDRRQRHEPVDRAVHGAHPRRQSR